MDTYKFRKIFKLIICFLTLVTFAFYAGAFINTDLGTKDATAVMSGYDTLSGNYVIRSEGDSVSTSLLKSGFNNGGFIALLVLIVLALILVGIGLSFEYRMTFVSNNVRCFIWSGAGLLSFVSAIMSFCSVPMSGIEKAIGTSSSSKSPFSLGWGAIMVGLILLFVFLMSIFIAYLEFAGYDNTFDKIKKGVSSVVSQAKSNSGESPVHIKSNDVENTFGDKSVENLSKKLSDLKKMKDDGLISEEEYNVSKKAILDSFNKKV